ncbi:MAG: hypothetical protein WC459_04975 [Patescibacteria group bacterium]
MLERLKYFFSNYKKPILIVGSIILLAFFIIFSIPKKKETPPPETKLPGEEIVAALSEVKKTELTEEEKEKNKIEIAGKSFAEFYGSYSNQSNYSNLESVLPLLTAGYKAEMSQALEGYRASYVPGEKYEGTTTKAMSLPVFESFDIKSGTATLVVKTQRRISKDTQANYTTKNQDIRLDFVKEGSLWLVDSAKWM